MDSNLSLVDRERAKYHRMYYNRPAPYKGPGVHLVPDAVEFFKNAGMLAGDSVTDYGCGVGEACIRLQDNGLNAIGVDLVDSMLPEYRHYVPFVEAPLWALPEDFPITDWSFSSHVLEHIVPEKVDDVLRAIEAHTVKGSFHQICHLPDIMGRENGPLHMAVQPWEWWEEKIKEHFEIEYFKKYEEINGTGFKETSCFLIPRRAKEKTAISFPPKPKSAETVCIVGHGPSGINSGLGAQIDAHETVIRFTWRRDQPPQDYGTKVSYIVTSLRNHGDIINEGSVPDKGTWMFGRPGQMPYEEMQRLSLRLKKFKPCMGREVWPWHFKFRDLGATGYIDPRQGEPGLIPSFSQGTGAIIMACVRINPSRINLVGFDNVWAGKQEGYNDWNAIRRGEAPRKSGHDLRVERLLIDELMEFYNVEIAPL